MILNLLQTRLASLSEKSNPDGLTLNEDDKSNLYVTLNEEDEEQYAEICDKEKLSKF